MIPRYWLLLKEKINRLYIRFRSFFTLDRRFLISILILTLVPLFLIEIFSMMSLYKSRIQNTRNELMSERIDDIDTTLQSIHSILLTFQQHEEMKEILQISDTEQNLECFQETIQSILSNHHHLKKILFVDFFTPNGSHYHFGEPLNDEGINQSNVEDLLKKTNLTFPPVYWSGIIPNYYNASSVDKIVVGVSPIYAIDTVTKQESLLGNFVIAIDPQLFQQIDPYYRNDISRIILSSQDNHVIYASTDFESGILIPPDLIDLFETNQLIHLMYFRDNPYIFFREHISTANWDLYLFLPLGYFLSDFYDIGLGFILVFFFVSIALYLYFLHFSRTYIRPIRKLTQHFMEYGKGKPLRPLRRSRRTYEEIGDLITWFNQYVEDIESRKKAEERLAQSLLRQKHIVTCISETIFQFDYQGRILFANPAWKNISGYNIDDCIGKKFLSFIPLDQKEVFFTSFQEIVENRRESISAKFQIIRQDGNLSWVEIHLTPMIESSSIVGVLSDITERIRIDTLRDEFISTVSHELRTPMCAIQEGLHLMQEPQSGELNETQKQLLEITIRNIDRLSGLINNVLDYQKYQSETKHITLYYESLHDTIQEAILLMEPIVKQKGLTIQSILDPYVPLVMFNKDSILQVCINLINNAIKFTEKGGITIRTLKFDHEVCVCVEDTGIGIPTESISELFESFTQLSKKYSDKIKGTGLGLSICKKIILRHNGKIWVESTIGKGSTFCFTIPLVSSTMQNDSTLKSD